MTTNQERDDALDAIELHYDHVDEGTERDDFREALNDAYNAGMAHLKPINAESVQRAKELLEMLERDLRDYPMGQHKAPPRVGREELLEFVRVYVEVHVAS